MSIALALAVCGCGLRGNVDLLEARLREQDDRLHVLTSELEQTQTELKTARREADLLRDQLHKREHVASHSEQTAVLARVEGVRIGALLSGGLDRDEQPGDDLLSALVVPHDADGEVLKLPGTIRLELFDLSRDGNRQRIGEWEFEPEQTRERWHSGFLAAGYRFRVPWQQSPKNETLLLHARLTTPDGRQFDASETIRITPPPTIGNAGRPQDRASEPSTIEQTNHSAPAGPLPTSDRWTEHSRPVIR